MRFSSVSEVAAGSRNGKATGSCFRQGPATGLVMACFSVSGQSPPHLGRCLRSCQHAEWRAMPPRLRAALDQSGLGVGGATLVRLAQQRHIGYRQSGTQAGSGAEPVHPVLGREREKPPVRGCWGVPMCPSERHKRSWDKEIRQTSRRGAKAETGELLRREGWGGDDGLTDWWTVAD